MSLHRIACAVSLALLLTAAALAKDPPQTNRVSPELKPLLFGMRGFPPVAEGMDAKKLFPMIDMFGQYRHKDWPGKVHAVEDLARNKQTEAADLAANAGPAGWDQFGGWKDGPQLKATGHFRTVRREGKWWLVDPEGRLFWSHGIDCIDAHWSTTPITDRHQWFAELPGKDSPFGQFYGRGTWAPHNYYEGKSYETFDFSGANLLRKYGSDWRQQFDDLCHRRLRSWGMNTIGNWSNHKLGPMHRTPYVVTVNAGGRPLEGSQGYWGKFADVFAEGFNMSVRANVSRQSRESADDPWCLGYYVDNELAWGDELSLAIATLASPAEQPAKKVFVADLQKKYGDIAKLNQAWGTAHASWDALAASRTPPDKKKAYDDLAAFATKTAEQYFRTCRTAVKDAAPQVLYLGCRFAWTNDRAIRAAGKFCDVISFNRYQKSIEKQKLPEGVDLPMMIGEFHFGALDRGMFHTGLVATADQKSRAEAYRNYVEGALRHPNFVGTHWFQFGDQAVTGRGDGENYQIGFIDVCDTPYAETIAASRAVGAEMYSLRGGK